MPIRRTGQSFALLGLLPHRAPFRCVQLVWASDFENPAAWADFVTKLKEGILAAFDSAFTQREAEVKRSEGQVQMPGWNFCTFFVLKVIRFTLNLCHDKLNSI